MFSSVTDLLKSKIQKKHSRNLFNCSVIHDHPRQRFHENKHNAPRYLGTSCSQSDDRRTGKWRENEHISRTPCLANLTSVGPATYVHWQRGIARIFSSHAAAAAELHPSIDISCLSGHSLWAHAGTDRRTDTVSLHRPCSATRPVPAIYRVGQKSVATDSWPYFC